MTVLRLRFRLWLFGQRVCDYIGDPVNVVLRWLRLDERIGACDLLHGVAFRGDIPQEWWG